MLQTHHRVLNASETECLILQTHHRVPNASDTECLMLQTPQSA